MVQWVTAITIRLVGLLFSVIARAKMAADVSDTPHLALALRHRTNIGTFLLRTGAQKVCVASIFVVTCQPAAWALTEESPIELPNGCTIFLQQFHGPATIYQADGRCKDGLAEGMWLIGREQPSASGNRVKTVTFSGFSKGRANGFSLRLAEFGSRVSVNEPDLNGVRFLSGDRSIKHDEPDADFQRYLAQVDQANSVARSLKFPTADANRAKALIRQWRANPTVFFDQYLAGEPTTPPWANGMSQSVRSLGAAGSSTTVNQTDDPKARGRSARVM